MQSSAVSWEERELARVLPKIPSSVCVFCHEVISSSVGHSAAKAVTTESRRSTHHKRRKRCFPRLARPSSYIWYPGSRNSSISRDSTLKFTKNVRKPRENLSSSSSSASPLSLYTSDSSDDEPDKDSRSSNDSPISKCSFPYDPPAETIGLPQDYLSKYSSLQEWLAKRKSLRNAMGSKGDYTRWLQNKKPRTPLEERVLALSKSNSSNNQENTIQAFKCSSSKPEHSGTFSRVGSDNRESAVGSTTSWSIAADIRIHPPDSQTSSQRISKPSDYSMLHEFPAGKLASSLDIHVAEPSENQNSSQQSQRISKPSDYSMSHEFPAGELVSSLDSHVAEPSENQNLSQQSQSQTSSQRISEPSDYSMSHEFPAGKLVSSDSHVAEPSENQNLSQKITASTDHLISRESSSGELVSVLDQYLTQRRIRLLDLFRCVDVSRVGSCSRRDFRYVLKKAKVPLTKAQVEQLADSLAVDDSVDYSQLVVGMNRHSEMKLFRKPRGDPGDDRQSTLTINGSQSRSLLITVGGGDADEAAATICPEAVRTDQKRSYCRRVIKLFRDNTLFGEVKAGKTSSLRRNVVTDLKSTLDDDEGLATRLQEIRLRDRVEYEATRAAVRRQRLPVSGRALRRGLLTAADRPHSAIDVRRLPSEHMLAGYSDSTHGESQITTEFDSDDSLDEEMEKDERRCAASVSISQFSLRVRSATSSRHQYGSRYSDTSRSVRDEHSSQGSVLGISGENGEMSKVNKQEKGEKSEDRHGKDGKDGKGDAGIVGDRLRKHLEWRRILWELEEEKARKNATYWPGRANHVRVYHAEGDRGGHPIFERVGQQWYNDDPRYLLRNSDDQVVERCHYRSSPQQHQSRWTWQRAVEYRAAGPLAVYRCVPVNDSVHH